MHGKDWTNPTYHSLYTEVDTKNPTPAKNAKTLNPLLDTFLGGCRTFGVNLCNVVMQVNWLAVDLRGRVRRVLSTTCNIMAGSTWMNSPPTWPPPALHYAVSAAEKIVNQQKRIFTSAVLRSAASTSHLRILLPFRCHSLVCRYGSSQNCHIPLSSPVRPIRYLDHGLRWRPSFLSDALKEAPQAAYYQYLAPNDRAEIHFEGDDVRSGPNMMWLWTTGGMMILDCFSSRHEPLKVRGYVFQDQKRLEEWNIPNEEYGTWVEGRSARIRKALTRNPE